MRDRDGRAYVEGVRFLCTALDAKVEIDAVVTSPQLESPVGRRLVQSLARRGVPILRLTDAELASLSVLDSPQGIGAVIRQRWTTLDDDTVAPRDRHALWVAVDRVQKPGNLGSLLRTCDAVGARGLLLLHRDVDPYDPIVVRATMGSLFTLQLARAAPSVLREWNRHGGHYFVGAGLEGSHDYRAISYARPLVLLLGSERQGLSDAQRALCDTIVRIPMVGGCDSLNLAAAGAVLLYEVWNQRHPLRRRR